ncbi:hypothetical protein [Nocardia suismassiliense]|uniref:hypothetical protein n=1 Tax=Nocardia suismassiliense TaxID=2077092 RepID=UPI000D1E45CE|nr:hypothetical protein [Nocardia suismassiliense]
MRDPKPWDNGTVTDEDYQRMQNDRGWAPPGGTSMDEHFRVASQLEAAVRATLASALPSVPALSVGANDLNLRYPQAGGWYTLWENQGPGVYRVSIGLEHRRAWPIDDQRTHLAVAHHPAADSLEKCPIVDARMHGLLARDPRQLTNMALTAIEQHRCTRPTHTQ